MVVGSVSASHPWKPAAAVAPPFLECYKKVSVQFPARHLADSVTMDISLLIEKPHRQLKYLVFQYSEVAVGLDPAFVAGMRFQSSTAALRTVGMVCRRRMCGNIVDIVLRWRWKQSRQSGGRTSKRRSQGLA